MIKFGTKTNKVGCNVNALDEIEVGILLHLLEDPRIQIGEIADSLSVARNTVSARMRRLEGLNVLRAGGREVDLGVLGFDVLAFITLEVSHRELDPVVKALHSLERVLEVHEISGRGDVWCRVAAQDTKDLHRTLRSILRIRGVVRAETSLALKEHFPYRVQPLLRGLAKSAP